MRTTVTIDDGLLADAKVLAARTHRTLSSVLEDALRELIARSDAAPDAPEVALPSHGSGGVRPGVDLLDREQLAELLGDNAVAR